MNTYLQHLRLNEHLEENLLQTMEVYEYQITSLAREFQNGNIQCLEKVPDLMVLAVILSCLDNTKRLYDERGISQEIFYDTMADIRVWCENNGNRGLKNYQWIGNHVHFTLFRLGRLQFQIYNCCTQGLDYTRLPFSRCEPVIYIHIPQGEKLDYEACRKSVEQAKEFFATYFPEFEYRYFFCESWLLFEKNPCFMKPDSNIVRFASLFDIAYSVEEDDQAIERIFGDRKERIEEYQEESALQRSAKAYMLSGNRLGVGVGTIPLQMPVHPPAALGK